MKKLTLFVKDFIKQLIDSEIIRVQNNRIILTEDDQPIVGSESAINYYDHRGIGPIETDFGGRKIKALEDLKAQYKASGDKYKVAAANTSPEYVVINMDLNPNQAKMYFNSIQDYFFVTSMKEKEFGNSNQKGAFIVFEFLDENNKRIENHLVATASNFSMPGTSGYEKYLDLTPNSAARWLYNYYKRLESTGQIPLTRR